MGDDDLLVEGTLTVNNEGILRDTLYVDSFARIGALAVVGNHVDESTLDVALKASFADDASVGGHLLAATTVPSLSGFSFMDPGIGASLLFPLSHDVSGAVIITGTAGPAKTIIAGDTVTVTYGKAFPFAPTIFTQRVGLGGAGWGTCDFVVDAAASTGLSFTLVATGTSDDLAGTSVALYWFTVGT